MALLRMLCLRLFAGYIIEDTEGSFADISGCFADMWVSFADAYGSFADAVFQSSFV